jgi:hypothetical protein
MVDDVFIRDNMFHLKGNDDFPVPFFRFSVVLVGDATETRKIVHATSPESPRYWEKKISSSQRNDFVFRRMPAMRQEDIIDSDDASDRQAKI